MRTVTFSDPQVIGRLRRDFVCAWTNIRPDENFKGAAVVDPAGRLRRLKLANGTGAQNICAMIATPAGTVVHAVPGYCDPETFLRELEFGLEAVARAAGPDPEERLSALYVDRLEHPVKDLGQAQVLFAVRRLSTLSPRPDLDVFAEAKAAGLR